MRTTISQPNYIRTKQNKVKNRIKQTHIPFNKNYPLQNNVIAVPSFVYCPIMGAIYYLKKIIYE